VEVGVLKLGTNSVGRGSTHHTNDSNTVRVMVAPRGPWTAAFVASVRSRLRAVADPARAVQQAKYMRNQYPFLGASNPQTRAVVAATFVELGLPWEAQPTSTAPSGSSKAVRRPSVVGEEETAAVLRALWEQVRGALSCVDLFVRVCVVSGCTITVPRELLWPPRSLCLINCTTAPSTQDEREFCNAGVLVATKFAAAVAKRSSKRAPVAKAAAAKGAGAKKAGASTSAGGAPAADSGTEPLVQMPEVFLDALRHCIVTKVREASVLQCSLRAFLNCARMRAQEFCLDCSRTYALSIHTRRRVIANQ
jgi:hypothetical protein